MNDERPLLRSISNRRKALEIAFIASLILSSSVWARPIGQEGRAELRGLFPAAEGALIDSEAPVTAGSVDVELTYVSRASAHRAMLMRREPAGAQRAITSRRIAAGDDLGQEILVLRDAPEAGAIVFSLRADGIDTLVRSGRGVRSFGAPFNASDGFALGAPLLIGSDGRPSTAAEWEISRRLSDQRFELRLRINERRLRYPAAVMFAFGKPGAVQSVPATSRLRTRLTPKVDATGAISGRVTSTTGAPIAFEIVEIWSSIADFVTFGVTDANGFYTSEDGLPSGSYRVTAWAPGYVREVYNNIPCPFECDVTVGTAVNVVDGSTTSNVNFTLASTVNGLSGFTRNRLTAGALPNVAVAVYDSTGSFVTLEHSDGTGAWAATLPADGTYFVRTLNSVHAGYVDVLYNNIDCTGCNVTTGTGITLSGSTVSNVVLGLSPGGGRISGRITDAATGAGIGFANVDIFDSTGQAVNFATADSAGNYTSFLGMRAGSYYVKATANHYDSKLYDNVPCTGACSPSSGTAVPVTFGATAQNINVALRRNDVIITGSVRDAASGAPLPSVAAIIHDESGAPVASAFTDINGVYRVSLDVPGTYFARTLDLAHHGYVDQLYDGFPCSRCDVTQGTAIQVAAGVAATGINFSLARNGGSIRGSVTDSEENPIEFALVQIFASNGQFVTEAVTGHDGTYALTSLLAAGSYYAEASQIGFQSQLFDGVPCAGECNPTDGSPILVTAGQTTSNVNFALATSLARVSGAVVASPNATPLAGVQVVFYDTNGDVVASDTTGNDGKYEVALADSGSYFARTFAPNPLYTNQLYQNIPCSPSCNPTAGTAIAATLGSLTPNISFTLTASSCATISVGPATLPGGTAGTPYSATITATGGSAPYTFAIGGGQQPPGLEIDGDTGVLAGEPTEGGSFSFQVVVLDAVGCVGSASYTVVIESAATGTTLSVSPANPAYGTPLVLTAVVSPSTVTGTVTFRNGMTVVGTSPVSSGSATLTLSNLNAGAYDFTATYDGDATHDPSTSAVVHVEIHKVTPSITWTDPAPIVYGTAISGTQLNATASVAGSFTYSVSIGSILDAGTYTLNVVFIPADTTNYTDAAKSVTLVVQKADQGITWPDPPEISYGTPLGPSQLNAVVTVPGPSAAGAITYTPASGTILPVGTHTLSVAVAATPNYNPAAAQVSLTVTKATPVFSDLTSPVVTFGSPAVISGRISAGTVIPPGNVTIMVNGVSQTAAIQPDGTFTATFATAGLPPISSGYPVSFSYAGDSNFNPASGSSVLYTSYGVSGGLNSNGPVPGTGTANFRVKIVDAAGANRSSSSIAVTAYGIRPAAGMTWTPPSGTGNGDFSFKFQNADGGSYLYGERLNGLAPGNYVLGFQVAGDPVIHEIPFAVK